MLAHHCKGMEFSQQLSRYEDENLGKERRIAILTQELDDLRLGSRRDKEHILQSIENQVKHTVGTKDSFIRQLQGKISSLEDIIEKQRQV